MKKVAILIQVTSCNGCNHYSNGAGFCEPSCDHPNKYKDGDYVSENHVPDTCPARLHPVAGTKCTCHERDSTYICEYCLEQIR